MNTEKHTRTHSVINFTVLSDYLYEFFCLQHIHTHMPHICMQVLMNNQFRCRRLCCYRRRYCIDDWKHINETNPKSHIWNFTWLHNNLLKITFHIDRNKFVAPMQGVMDSLKEMFFFVFFFVRIVYLLCFFFYFSFTYTFPALHTYTHI